MARLQDRSMAEQARRDAQVNRAAALAKIRLALNDDGTLNALDSFGERLPPADMRLLWDQQGHLVESWLEERIREISGDPELIVGIHHDTPAPDQEPAYTPAPFDVPEPVPPQLPVLAAKPVQHEPPALGLFARLSKARVARHAADKAAAAQAHKVRYRQWLEAEQHKAHDYRALVQRHDRTLAAWREQREAHAQREQAMAEQFPARIRQDVDLMASLLDTAICELSWPRETLVAYELADGGATVWLDVDLPEIEDIPQRLATLSANRRRLLIRSKSKTTLAREYAAHVHGIALRLAGTVFATVPSSTTAVVSGYSQRRDPATGTINDDYLLSVRFDRAGFERIDFGALETVDPVAAVDAFQNRRRRMTKAGRFSPIEPFEAPPGADRTR
jgi:hypothetical protein